MRASDGCRCGCGNAGAHPDRLSLADRQWKNWPQPFAKERRPDRVEIVLRKVDEVTSDDILKADGIVLGTPVEWGNLSAEAKRFLDRVGEALGKAGANGEGRTAAVFCTAGGPSNGQEMARMAAIAAFLAMRFVIVGGVNDEGFGSLGPQAVTAGKLAGVNDRDRADARRFGERFARLTRQFRAAATR